MTSVAEQLQQYAELLEAGHITRAEYESEKARLLCEEEDDSPPAPGPGSLDWPEEIGAYRLLGFLGDAGQGSVHLGRHRDESVALRQGGDVAIQLMHAPTARGPSFEARFLREARLGLKLKHPGIVPVLDLFSDQGTLGLVRERVEGRPLSETIGAAVGPTPWLRAQSMCMQLLDSVGYLHRSGMLHRDIKPAHVIVTPDGRLLLFGLGIGGEEGGEAPGIELGPGAGDYLAPEQYLDARNVDERADIYALGMTFYELLAGRLPWGEDVGDTTVFEQKAVGEIVATTSLSRELPDHVVAAVLRSLSHDPDDRFPDTKTFGRALEGAGWTLPPQPPPSLPSQTPWPGRLEPGGPPLGPPSAQPPPSRPQWRGLSLIGMLLGLLGVLALIVLGVMASGG